MVSPTDRLHLKSVKLAVVRKLTSITKGSARSGFGRNQVLEDRTITREITLFYQSSRNPHHNILLSKQKSFQAQEVRDKGITKEHILLMT